jgi:hypothetical protein
MPPLERNHLTKAVWIPACQPTRMRIQRYTRATISTFIVTGASGLPSLPEAAPADRRRQPRRRQQPQRHRPWWRHQRRPVGNHQLTQRLPNRRAHARSQARLIRLTAPRFIIAGRAPGPCSAAGKLHGQVGAYLVLVVEVDKELTGNHCETHKGHERLKGESRGPRHPATSSIARAQRNAKAKIINAQHISHHPAHAPHRARGMCECAKGRLPARVFVEILCEITG